ncbi:hypothetical protein J6590_023660 [Homalodisca vitripennis]|nr:hypothetical protein J6590_023660 [Homalodisca vitripennis]
MFDTRLHGVHPNGNLETITGVDGKQIVIPLVESACYLPPPPTVTHDSTYAFYTLRAATALADPPLFSSSGKPPQARNT